MPPTVRVFTRIGKGTPKIHHLSSDAQVSQTNRQLASPMKLRRGQGQKLKTCSMIFRLASLVVFSMSCDNTASQTCYDAFC